MNPFHFHGRIILGLQSTSKVGMLSLQNDRSAFQLANKFRSNLLNRNRFLFNLRCLRHRNLLNIWKGLWFEVSFGFAYNNLKNFFLQDNFGLCSNSKFDIYFITPNEFMLRGTPGIRSITFQTFPAHVLWSQIFLNFSHTSLNENHKKSLII